MADKKISALTASTTPLAGTEVLPIVQSGATVKVSVANLTAGRAVAMSGITNTGSSDLGAQADSITLGGYTTRFSGASVTNNGTDWYGSYGRAIWNANASTTSGARRFAFVNGINYTNFGLIRSVDANTDPALGGNGGTVSSGTLDWSMDTSGNMTVHTGTATIAGATQTDGLVSHAGTGGAFGSNKFNFQWTGNPILWVDGTNVGQIATVSDYRIKRNIASQTESGLAKVMQLRPVVYQLANYNNLFVASDDIKEGFIAHELQEVIPSAVSGQKDAEDQIQSLKLDAVCAVLAKAIQEQQAQIEALKADVAALKGA